MYRMYNIDISFHRKILLLCLFFGIYSINLLIYNNVSRFSELTPEPDVFWPPNSALTTRSVNGTYDLKVPVRVSQHLFDQPTFLELRTRTLTSSRHNASPKISLLKQWYDLEDPNRRNQFDVYPLTINLKAYIANISSGLSTDRAPIYHPTVKLLHVSSTVCAPTASSDRKPNQRYDLVIVSKSSVKNFNQRQRMRRQVYETNRRRGFNVGLVFIVGLPSLEHSRYFHMDGFNISLKERAGRVLDQTEPKDEAVLERMTRERAKHDDLIVGDFLDTYFNLTLKAIVGRLWATHFCRNLAHVFLFADDDMHFSLQDIAAYLFSLPMKDQQFLVAGRCHRNSLVIRPQVGCENKWAVSEDEIPWPLYPDYMSGTFYMLGYKHLPALAIASLYTKHFRLEDVYLGFLLKKLNISIHNLPKSVRYTHMNE